MNVIPAYIIITCRYERKELRPVMIELNFTNMMDCALGDRGISDRQIEATRGSLPALHSKIMDRAVPGLSFIDLLSQDTGSIKETATFIRENSDDFLLLGIGGSALGPRAILDSLSPFHNLKKRPRVFICDNVDPATLRNILSVIDIKRTSVNVITKSGSTAETASSFMVIWDELRKAFGSRASERVVATTDPEKGNLRMIANELGFRTLAIPAGVGGRYSVLSPVGLLPAEVIGIDSVEMLRGARDIHERCSNPDIWNNPAYLFGTLLYLMDRNEKRNINVMIPYADSLKAFSEWFCQLWAESLGKDGKGITPYPSLGAVDQHSQLQLWIEGPQDKVIVFIRVLDYGADIKIPAVFGSVDGIGYLGNHLFSDLIKAEEESTELALVKNKRPNMTITIPLVDAYHIGQLFHFFNVATAFTGFMYDIDPFNQPGVEEGKNFTYGMMGKKGFEAKRLEVEKEREKKACYRV